MSTVTRVERAELEVRIEGDGLHVGRVEESPVLFGQPEVSSLQFLQAHATGFLQNALAGRDDFREPAGHSQLPGVVHPVQMDQRCRKSTGTRSKSPCGRSPPAALSGAGKLGRFPKRDNRTAAKLHVSSAHLPCFGSSFFPMIFNVPSVSFRFQTSPVSSLRRMTWRLLPARPTSMNPHERNSGTKPMKR